MSNPEYIRECFETWYSDGGQSPKAVARDSSGYYRLMGAANAWTAWQAAWQFAEPSTQIFDDMKELAEAAKPATLIVMGSLTEAEMQRLRDAIDAAETYGEKST